MPYSDIISFFFFLLLTFHVVGQQTDFDPEQDARNQQRYSRQAYEDDDDGYHHGPRVQQCTTS